MVEARDLPVEDLREILTVATARGGYLLTAGERVVLQRIETLDGEPARLYARLTTRRPTVFRLAEVQCLGVEDVPTAVAVLVERGLADHLVPWDRRAAALPIADLKRALRSLDLSTAGRRAELVDRLKGHTHWQSGLWFRIRHRSLIARLECWYFLRPHRDRSTLVVDRLGHARWPTYSLTRGSALFRDRRALLKWEALRDPDLSTEAALRALSEGAYRAPGGLDLGRRLRRSVVASARALEGDEPAAARALYVAVGVDTILRAELAPRVARTLEAQSRFADALTYLREVLPSATGAERIAIQRAGRRIARHRRCGWAPDRPLVRPSLRHLRLPKGHRSGPRPRYRVDGLDLTVEEAVCAELRRSGRRALHVEGALWSTLFALLFSDCFFLDVPGALPVRFLSGPLDLGTAQFRMHRARDVESVLEGVRAGEAAARIQNADLRYRGYKLAGARWEIADAATLAAIADGIGPAALCDILRTIVDKGSRATRGLPDLVILPGPTCQLRSAFPRQLDSRLLLVEVKGPGDTVRDSQAVWLDRLLRSRARVELWEVQPSTVV